MAANNNSNDVWKDEYESMMAKFNDLPSSYIIQMADQLRYCNYDPKALYKKIVMRIAVKKWNARKSYCEIRKAVRVGLVRGNVTMDQIKKMARGGGIVQLAADFGIHIRRNTREKMSCKPDTLTFVRFVSLFPHVASQLCLMYPSESTQKIPCNGVYSACTLPAGMKHSGFAALIPRGPEYRAVRGYLSVAFTAFMVEFSDAIINPSKSNRAPQVKFEEQFRLTKTAIDDGIMSDKQRIIALKVATINSRAALERILKVVEIVRRVHGMPVEDPRSYVDETVVEGDVWKFGCTREIEEETGDKADKNIEGKRKNHPDYGKVMDHTGCSAPSSSTGAAASSTADLPSTTEVVVLPGLTGFSI